MPTSNSSRARRTSQPARGPSRWFPQRKDFTDYKQWDTHYRAYEHIYALQDQLSALTETVNASMNAATSGKVGTAVGNAASRKASVPAPHEAGGATGTYVLGIAVKAGVPADGTKLTYSKRENQFIFQ